MDTSQNSKLGSSGNPTPIPDHLAHNLKIVFIGFNPSLRSGESGHHYANPNNRFWTILHRSGLTPRKYKPEEDADLLELGYGLTNIVARPTKTAAEIMKEEYAQGRTVLRRKLADYLPKIACFVGKGVFEQYSGHRQADWGVQAEASVPGVVDFIAPSTSGLVRMKTEEMVEIFARLADLAK